MKQLTSILLQFKQWILSIVSVSYSKKQIAKHRELHLKILVYGYKKGKEWNGMGSMSSEYNNWLDDFYNSH